MQILMIPLEGVSNANNSIDEDIEGVGAAPNDNNEGVETDIVVKQQKYHSNGRPMRINRRYVKDKSNGTNYDFATHAQAKEFGLDTNTLTPTATAFLHVQTEYFNSLNSYGEVNTAIQHAAEHLAFTQLGMKAGIKM